MVTLGYVTFSARTQLWCVVVVVILATVMEVATLNGPNVCMVKQKYNITKRVKYRAPMSVRTYEWCMSLPPRCSKWSTEMRDLTRLETEERTAEVAVCCPGYKMRDVSCVPICPNGRTGHGCSQECPQYKWGPNCVNDCQPCSDHGTCSPITGECFCQEGWQGESCESRMSSTTSTTTATTARVEELLTKKPATKPTPPITSIPSTAKTALVETTSIPSISRTIAFEIASSTSRTTSLETTASPSTKDYKETTSTPKTTHEEIILSPKKSDSLDSAPHLSMTTLLDYTTVKANPLTTPVTSTFQTLQVSTTKAPVTVPITLTSSSIETTSVKPSTTGEPIQSPITENGFSTEIKTYKLITDKAIDKKTTTITTEPYKPTTVYNNVTIGTTEAFKEIAQTKQMLTSNYIYNRTEPPHHKQKYVKEVHVEIKTTPIRILKTSETIGTATQKTTALSVFTETPIVATPHTTTMTEQITKIETTRRPDATIRYFPTTVKFKPKEIWIRPAQKGDSFAETKKINHDLHLRHRVATHKEPAPNTTPKTIIVSIIPTSVSYATFKKIALTTVSLLSQTTNITLKSYNKSTEQGFTKPMLVLTTTLPPHTATLTSVSPNIALENSTKPSIFKSVNSSKSNSHFYKAAKTISTLSNTGTTWKKPVTLNETNSMTTVEWNLNSSLSITQTVSSTNFTKASHKPGVTTDKSTFKDSIHVEKVTKPLVKTVIAKPKNVTTTNMSGNINNKDSEKTNATKTKDIANAKTNKITTESPDDEETFHILTEPEHITAVMEGKGNERTSVDLISVISIAGGIMMAVITVAVIIVMVERCRKPRYEDVRKMNDIHMQVMIDNNDEPPPYVRSIFHTPLPEPPTSEKCHYQPISTLDRNLKQFMRPVVVQTISPIMLENFRGILECHYDHLPRRSHDYEPRQKHCSIPPSIDNVGELAHLRPCSIAESTIDALKCEAKLDVLDSTTSEPLYAEIPCWRPPSEHAIEIMNLNGEAVTEL